MTAPRVHNRRHSSTPDDAVDISRASEWGNPFRVMKGRTRAQAIAIFKGKLLADPQRVAEVRLHLRGRDLVCWCKPKACHGDVLLEVANRDALI